MFSPKPAYIGYEAEVKLARQQIYFSLLIFVSAVLAFDWHFLRVYWWKMPAEAKRVDFLMELGLEVIVHQVVICQVLPVGHHFNNSSYLSVTEKLAS